MADDFRAFLEDFSDWLNGQEAGFVKLRLAIQRVLGEAKPSPELPFDVSKIVWQNKENEKGKFQISEDYDSLDHKALLKFLEEHTPSKCVTSKDSQGLLWFIWTYRNGSTIGRKLREAKP